MNPDLDKITEVILKVLRAQDIELESKKDDFTIPVGVSNHHVHLTEEHIEICFGKGYELTPIKDLTQPGQFACKETVTLCGPKGAIEKIRILGPARKESQVELLVSDNYKLGLNAPLRLSGEIKGSAPITVVGPKGSVYLEEGAIVARRHIHMMPEDARRFGVSDGETVSVRVNGERGGVMDNVIIRANNTSKLDFHIDTEEANALGLGSSDKITIIKQGQNKR